MVAEAIPSSQTQMMSSADKSTVIPTSSPAVGGEKARGHLLFLFAIAAAIALLHLATNNRYGFHRDELQFLSDARHLDWGFVSYPPFTPFIERIGLSLFGLSLVGLRLFSVIAQGVVIVVSWIDGP